MFKIIKTQYLLFKAFRPSPSPVKKIRKKMTQDGVSRKALKKKILCFYYFEYNNVWIHRGLFKAKHFLF